MYDLDFAQMEKYLSTPLGEEILRLMHAENIVCAEIRYEGYEDSGGVESVDCYRKSEPDGVPMYCETSNLLREKLQCLGDEILSKDLAGFEINEGGQGTIYLVQEDGIWNGDETRVEHFERIRSSCFERISVPESILNSEKAQAVLSYMESHGETLAKIYYEGSCDSGGITECVFGGEEVHAPKDIAKILRDVGNAVLDECLAGFEINEGGEGFIQFVRDGKSWVIEECVIEHNSYYEEYV